MTTVRSIRQPVASLSGGQRQSVAIAKAVLWNAKLVIMDEPTAALGVAQTAMVLDLVRRLADRGLAVLLVSHNMNDVFEVADRIAVLHLGRVVAVRPASRARPADRGRPDDDRRVGAARRRHGRRTPDGQGRRDRPSRRESDAPDARARLRQAELAVPAEIAADSLGEYFRPSLARIKAGESGVLPVVAGLLLISILFQSLNSNFLTAGNLVNLLVQGAVFMLLAMGEVFVLLLGEIDLSVGFVAGIGGVIMADLASPATAGRGGRRSPPRCSPAPGSALLQGTIITRIGLPSFVVTLAGLLFWQGVMLMILGNGGTIPITTTRSTTSRAPT